MFQVILHQPEIPPNTGNIMRLCANSGCRLHLIEPLGFSLDRRSVRRAGLDYAPSWPVRTRIRASSTCLRALAPRRLFAIETARHAATTRLASKPATCCCLDPRLADCHPRCWRLCRWSSGCGFRCCPAIAASISPTRWPWWSTRPGDSRDLTPRPARCLSPLEPYSNSGLIGRAIRPRTTCQAGNRSYSTPKIPSQIGI